MNPVKGKRTTATEVLLRDQHLVQVLGIHDKVAGASRSIWKACLEAVDLVICSQERQKQNVRGRSVAHNERRAQTSHRR